jgi:hypothetical protein
MSAATRYLGFLLSATLAILGAVAVFNLLVDPYGLFHVVNRDGFNRIKSQAGQRAEMFKRHGVERMRPNALVLGNSRAEIGFDPQSSAWPSSLRPVFNLALPGTSVDSALDEFSHVLEFATPKFVIVGLDFLDFRVDPSVADDPPPARNGRWHWFRERLSALLTINALADSLATLKAQRDPYSTGLSEAGFNPMRDYVGIARREGYHAMFRQRDWETAKSYARGSKTIYLPDGRPAPEFLAVERIIATAGQAGIPIRLVIYPVHAHALVLIHQAGLWPAFEAWKRELVIRVDGARFANVELWDFSGFTPYADESIPPPGDKTSEMRWYWEGGHFKKSLGDALLARIFGGSAEHPAWGRQLTARNLDEQLQQQRAARDEYEILHAAEVRNLSLLAPLAGAGTRQPRGNR